jgi:hypothetical protein
LISPLPVSIILTMTDEFDRKLIPEILQSAFTISLGASYKGFEMVKTPRDSLDRMWREAKSLVTIPDDAGEGVQEKFKALAAVWLEKGASWMKECRSAGEKFVEDDKEGK